MSTQTLSFTPIDAWFFRDGRPFNSGEANQIDIASLFPPPATTLVGAIRAALAREHGWKSGRHWPTDLHAILGDGFDNLGSLQFHGPWLSRTRNGQSELLFPMPLQVLGQITPTSRTWQPVCLLGPGAEVSCDLGRQRLPTPIISGKNQPLAGLKEPSSQWITEDGFKQVLAGQVPNAKYVVEGDELWRAEGRVGLARDHDKHTALIGHLYSPRFARLAHGVAVRLTVDGLPETGWDVPALLPLGGEGRLADCQYVSNRKLPQVPSELIQKNHRCTVTLITPLLIPNGNTAGTVNVPQAGAQFFDWPGTTVVSACVGKMQSLGGWDSTKNRPLELRPTIPPGATWFLTLDESAVTNVLQRHGQCLGLKTAFGFGQIALGTWAEIS